MLSELFLSDDNVISVAKRAYQAKRTYTDPVDMVDFNSWVKSVRRQMATYQLPDEDRTDIDNDPETALAFVNIKFIRSIVEVDKEFIRPEGKRKEEITINQFEGVWRQDINPRGLTRLGPNVLKTANLYRRKHDHADDLWHTEVPSEKEGFQRGDKFRMGRYVRTREQKAKYQSWGK